MRNKTYLFLAMAFIVSIFAALDANAGIVEKQIVSYDGFSTDPEDLNIKEYTQGNLKITLKKHYETTPRTPYYDAEKDALAIFPQNDFRIETLDGTRLDSVAFEYEHDPRLVIYNLRWDSGIEGKIEGNQWINLGNTNYMQFFFLGEPRTEVFLYLFKITVYTTGEGEPDPEPQPMGLELTIDDIYGQKATVGALEFTLNVTNDDGVKDFTLIAHNPDDATQEYCRLTFDRNSFTEDTPVQSYSEENSDVDAPNTYSIRGVAKLTKLGRNEETNLHVVVSANYPDGLTSSVSEPIMATVNTIGLTGIDDISADSEPAVYYNINGLQISYPDSPGIYIMRRGSSVQKICIGN